MSDESTTPARKPRTTKSGDTGALDTTDPVDAAETPVVAEAEGSDLTQVELTNAEVSETEPVVPTDQPDDVVTSVPRPQVIYVTAPAAPRPEGNRGFGALIALASTVLYVALLALVGALLGLLTEGRFSFDFLSNSLFFAPVLAFLIGFVLLVLIVNRAAWWSYILGSIFVGVFVYFATIGFGMLSTGVILETAEGARELFLRQLASPFVIISALLAREVSMWVGAGIAARGRRVKARYLTARETYDRELAEKRAEHERGAATPV
jgi:hypothetical protein